jgi:hypothetical protein
MTTKIEHQAQLIWDGLLIALRQLDCYQTELVSDEVRLLYEPECDGLYYTNDHNHVIVAIGSDQFTSNRDVDFFNSRKGQAVLKGILGREVRIAVENSKVFFKIPTHQAVEPMSA